MPNSVVNFKKPVYDKQKSTEAMHEITCIASALGSADDKQDS